MFKNIVVYVCVGLISVGGVGEALRRIDNLLLFTVFLFLFVCPGQFESFATDQR